MKRNKMLLTNGINYIFITLKDQGHCLEINVS